MEPLRYRLRENTDLTPWSVAVMNGLFGVFRAIGAMIAAFFRAIVS